MIPLANLVLIAAAVVWIVARQLRTAPVRPRALVVVPLVLAYVGLRGLGADELHRLADPVDIALLTASVAASTGLGLWRGLTLRVWQGPDGAWWRRGTWGTLALWVAVFAARGALVLAGRAAAHPQASGASVLLCCLALSFAAQNAVTLARTAGLLPARGPVLRPAPALESLPDAAPVS